MITKMLILVACWLVGYLVSVLVGWVSSPEPGKFSFKSILPQLILSLVLGVVASFFAAKIQLYGWLLWAIFIIAGFVSEAIIKFLANKAKQINGEK